MASVNNQVLVPGAAGNAGNAGNAVAFGPPTFQATIVGWVATLFTLFTTLWVQNHATVAAANQATQSFLGGFQALGQQLCFVRLTVVLLHGMTADHIKQAVVSTMVRFRDHHHQGLGEALRIFFLEANPVALKIFVISSLRVLFGVSHRTLAMTVESFFQSFGPQSNAVQTLLDAIHNICYPPVTTTPLKKCKINAKLLPDPANDSFNNPALGSDAKSIKAFYRRSSTPFTSRKKRKTMTSAKNDSPCFIITPSASEDSA